VDRLREISWGSRFSTLGTSRTPDLTRITFTDAHERATSVWYRVAGLLRRKDLAIEIIEGEIHSAEHQVWLEVEQLVNRLLTEKRFGVVQLMKTLRERAEQTIRPKS
jgi:hypothetical protein